MKKTTLCIDDGLMARVKAEAARRGKTMSWLVESALRRMLQERRFKPQSRPLPTWKGGAALVDIADRDALYRAMEGR